MMTMTFKQIILALTFLSTIITLSIKNTEKETRNLQKRSKWQIDLVTYGQVNQIKIKPGRFYDTTLAFQQNEDNSLAPASTTITLSDKVIKTMNAEYKISTFKNEPLEIYLGVPCATEPGEYKTTFTSSDKDNFIVSEVKVTVEAKEAAEINIKLSGPINVGTFALFDVSLSQINFDELKLKFTDGNDEGKTNDSTAKLYDLTIPSGTFSTEKLLTTKFEILSEKAKGDQVFKAENPNECFVIKPPKTTISLNEEIVPIPTTVSPPSIFILLSRRFDALITIDAIRPSAPSIVHCVLGCQGFTPPKDDDIISATTTTPITDYPGVLRFFKSYAAGGSNHYILLDKVDRGQEIYIGCITQIAHADKAKIKTSTLSLTPFTYSIEPIQCLTLNYVEPSDDKTKKDLINYCQNTFSKNGYTKKGCVVCADRELTTTSPGIDFPIRSTCNKAQKSHVSNPNPNSNTICVIQPNACWETVNFEETFALLKSNLDTTESIRKTLGNDKITIKSIFISNDKSSPADLLTARYIDFNPKTGIVSWKAKFITPLLCYYGLQSASVNKVPTFEDLENCTIKPCGKFNGADVSVSVADKLSTTEKNSYNVYYACYNDVAYASKRSEVVFAGYFDIASTLRKSFPLLNTNLKKNNYVKVNALKDAEIQKIYDNLTEEDKNLNLQQEKTKELDQIILMNELLSNIDCKTYEGCRDRLTKSFKTSLDKLNKTIGCVEGDYTSPLTESEIILATISLYQQSVNYNLFDEVTLSRIGVLSKCLANPSIMYSIRDRDDTISDYLKLMAYTSSNLIDVTTFKPLTDSIKYPVLPLNPVVDDAHLNLKSAIETNAFNFMEFNKGISGTIAMDNLYYVYGKSK